LEVARAELGESVVESGTVYSHNAAILKNELKWGSVLIGNQLVVPPQTLVARARSDDAIYYVGTSGSYGNWLYRQSVHGVLRVSESDPNDIRLAWLPPGMSVSREPSGLKPNKKPDVEFIEIDATERKSFRQEFIYNGGSGSSVKFIYREFTGDMARPAFTQELEYDLDEGSVIGFKGLRIEILSATNIELEYRVLYPFADR
jgi:hypothetical protein